MKIFPKDKAFSLIELIFIILIIAIIFSIFIPKIININQNNKLLKCKNDLNIINKNILIYKNNLLMKKENINFDISLYMDNSWEKISNTKFDFIFDDKNKISFLYNKNNFTFTCNKNKNLCKKVLN